LETQYDSVVDELQQGLEPSYLVNHPTSPSMTCICKWVSISPFSLLAKYSQKAILKTKSAKINFLKIFSIARI
jgi:hypothetical protein